MNVNDVNTKMHVHDWLFRKLDYDYVEKRIRVYISEPDGKTRPNYTDHYIDFLDVVGFHMVACNFWSQFIRIANWESYDREEQVLLKQLFEEKEKNNYDGGRLNGRSNYVETAIIVTSGDRLTIVCRSIITSWEISE